jgi:hypothetical protein
MGQPGVQIVAPLGGDDDERLGLSTAPRGDTCDQNLPPRTVTLHLDAGRRPPLSVEGWSTVLVAEDLIGLARPFPMLLTGTDGVLGGRRFVAADGTKLTVGGNILYTLPFLAACSSTADGALIILWATG